MILHWVFRSAMALLPVLVFLGALVYFDSFKVVRARAIVIAASACWSMRPSTALP